MLVDELKRLQARSKLGIEPDFEDDWGHEEEDRYDLDGLIGRYCPTYPAMLAEVKQRNLEGRLAWPK